MRYVATALLVFASSMAAIGQAQAGWTEVTGKVLMVTSYDHTSTVLVTLENQPTGPLPTGCRIDAFAIDGALSADRRQQMLSMLLSAQMANRNVDVSWDNAGNCVAYSTGNNFVRLVRIRTR